MYPRRAEMETERKNIFWAWVDQALHTSEQDWRSLGSEEGVLARSRIRSTISAGNCCETITRSWSETSFIHNVRLSTHSSSRTGELTGGDSIGSERDCGGGGDIRESGCVWVYIQGKGGLRLGVSSSSLELYTRNRTSIPPKNSVVQRLSTISGGEVIPQNSGRPPRGYPKTRATQGLTLPSHNVAACFVTEGWRRFGSPGQRGRSVRRPFPLMRLGFSRG